MTKEQEENRRLGYQIGNLKNKEALLRAAGKRVSRNPTPRNIELYNKAKQELADAKHYLTE